VTFLTIQGRALEVVRLPAAHPRDGAPALVFLHEGLGSVAMWRDFPQRVADATGCEAVVYSRCGYGRSAAAALPRTVSYMHDEARSVLPELLERLGIARPILVGHSDGASIALIHAGSGLQPLRGVIAMAPHVFVEEVSITSIAAARTAWQTTDLPQRLARYHDDAAAAFRGWNDIWLHPDFRAWNIEDCLPGIRVPLLAIQGEDDEYGTMEQLDRIRRAVADAEELRLAACRHSPHKDQPVAVIAAIARFIRRVAG
jgi:pimeloyl-ACP methyl ester carboxylesterase